MSTFEAPQPPNQQTRVDEVNRLTLREVAFFHQFTYDVGRTIIRLIRQYFEKNVRVPDEYRWVGKTDPDTGETETDQKLSKIQISSSSYDNEAFTPAVLLESSSLNLLDLWLNHRKMGALVIKNSRFTGNPSTEEPEYIEAGYRMGGKLNANITLKVRGITTAECDRISDALTGGFVGAIRWNLERENYNFLPNQGNISDRSPEATGEAKRPDFIRTHTYGLFLEWYDDFFYDTITVEEVETGELTVLPLSSLG